VVKFDFLERRSAERFAELLDDDSTGNRHRTRGSADGDLAELVAVGHRLSAARPGVRVDPEFRTGLRAMLLATAERDGIGVTAAEGEPEAGAHAGVREPGRGLFRAGSARRIRIRGAVVISVAAGAMAVSGISAASENASPGDALYGVKRSTERAQLAMAGSDVTRGQLSLDFAKTRLTEASALPGDTDAFGAVLGDMDADTKQGVKLLTSSAVARKDAAPLGSVESFVSAQKATFTPLMGKLSPANTERAQQSLDLLDAVSARTQNLRAGLACDTVVPKGTDALGPTLGSCASSSDPTTAPGSSHGTGERQGSKSTGSAKSDPVRPERTHPANGPDATEPAAPGDDPDGTGIAPDDNAVPSPTPAVSPTEDKGVLGGILGGILGN
jgi:hypothetical protein